MFMYGGRFAIFLSLGLAIVALIIEGRRDRKSILTGAAAQATDHLRLSSTPSSCSANAFVTSQS